MAGLRKLAAAVLVGTALGMVAAAGPGTGPDASMVEYAAGLDATAIEYG